MKYKLLLIINFVAIGVLVYVLFAIVYPPVKFKLNKPLLVTQATVRQGDNVEIVLDYCKYTDETPFTYFILVDHVLLPAIPAVLSLEKGCHTTTYQLNVAFSVPTGSYRVTMIKNYPVLIFKGVELIYHSNSFDIVPGVGGDLTK